MLTLTGRERQNGFYPSYDAASSGYGGSGQVTIDSSPTAMYRKTTILYEIGHALGDSGTSHMVGSDYSLSVSDANLCNCPDYSGNFVDDTTSHCITSKEKIRAAQNEGFAQFMVNAVINNRDENSAYFGYQSYLLRTGSEGDSPEIPPVAVRVIDISVMP
ncbi:MAG: hypothetical protein JXX29_03860 [Deltaproteobacteria bacterium]|nr:hypothetical protein [Deltaproteobacteria bacterium]MBN2670779.1 hypothetical protein [Deltaproteobacteria bacterium]